MIDAEAAIARFGESTRFFLELLDGVSEREWGLRPADESWSLAETVEHVVLANRSIHATLQQLLAAPLSASAVRYDDAAICGDMFATAPPPPPGVGEPKGRFMTCEQGLAALTEVRDKLIATARETKADLRDHGLPHPVFGVFDGVQWILFAAAHTDNHLPQLRALRAYLSLPTAGAQFDR
jgi:hypothetical protein